MRMNFETKSVTISTQPNGNICVTCEPLDTAGWPLVLPAETLYTIKLLEKRLGVGRRTVQNYMRRRVNPLPHSRAGGRPRVTESDLSAWLSREKTKEKIVIL